MKNARDKHAYRNKWGNIGPSHLLSEHGDLSVFIVSFETVLGREHSIGESGLQNSTGTFISEESPFIENKNIFRVRLTQSQPKNNGADYYKFRF